MGVGVTGTGSSTNTNEASATAATAITALITTATVFAAPVHALPPPGSKGVSTGEAGAGMLITANSTVPSTTCPSARLLAMGNWLRSPRVRLNKLRVFWVAVPVLVGPLFNSALDSQTSAGKLVGLVFLWIAWGIGLVGVLTPRPAGLTALRIIAPALLVVAIISAASCPAPADWKIIIGLIGALAVVGLVTDPTFARTAVNGVAYGDESRYPLRTPPGLFFGPVPLARAVAVIGLVSGPWALAANNYALAVVGFVVGIPLALGAARILHTLSRRWLVLVPAGVVLVDSLTIADPVLMVRRHIRVVRKVPGTATVSAGTLDLRLGASWGTIRVELDGETDLVRTRRGESKTLRPHSLVVAINGRRALLTDLPHRRITVG